MPGATPPRGSGDVLLGAGFLVAAVIGLFAIVVLFGLLAGSQVLAPGPSASPSLSPSPTPSPTFRVTAPPTALPTAAPTTAAPTTALPTITLPLPTLRMPTASPTATRAP